MRLSLQEILEATRGRLLRLDQPPPDAIVTGVSTDTRTLRPGDLFIPLRGPHADGHTFLADAFRRGAVAALTAHEGGAELAVGPLIQVPDPLRALGAIAGAHRRRLRATVVGITGSVGKTTTTKMTAAVLTTSFRVVQTREEWNAEVGVPLTLLGLTDAHEVAVIEMAMRGLGQIAELVEIAAPTIGVVTTIGESHLEFLGTLENVARAKGELIAGLPPTGTAVLNRDDPAVAVLGSLHRGRVMTYALDVPADVTAAQLRTTRAGVHFRLVVGDRSAEVALPTWGRHNVRNALAAAAVGVTMGLTLERIADGLARFPLPAKRLEPVLLGEVFLLNDTYNASPASMRAAFDVLAELAPAPRRIAVLGGMRELGPRSVAWHEEIGHVLGQQGVRLLITLGDDARPIADGAAAAGMRPAAMVHVRSREDVVAVLVRELRPDDVVLIKGSRALEMDRIIERLQAHRPSAAGRERDRA